MPAAMCLELLPCSTFTRPARKYCRAKTSGAWLKETMPFWQSKPTRGQRMRSPANLLSERVPRSAVLHGQVGSQALSKYSSPTPTAIPAPAQTPYNVSRETPIRVTPVLRAVAPADFRSWSCISKRGQARYVCRVSRAASSECLLQVALLLYLRRWKSFVASTLLHAVRGFVV